MRRPHAAIAAVTLVAAAALIFTGLGRYAFWNDEAYTALLAKSVWRTGDTCAVLGHNILAFQGGAALEGLRHRFDPPLAYYLAAPSLGLLGDSALAGRLPFALCGLAAVALMLRWAWRVGADTPSWLLLAAAVLGNVSLVLYSRQCRYYALALLCTTALAYLYVHWDGRPRGLAAMALVSLCLLATNYINYAAFYACAAADYLVWGRKRRPLSWRGLLVLFAPQVIIGAAVVYVWNPLGKAVVPFAGGSWLADRATLLWWNVRDLVRCEYGVGLFLLAAPVVARVARMRWLMRGSVALAVYIAAVSLLSPQPVVATDVADVRYLVPLIPLCIAIGVLVVRAIGRPSWWAAAALAAAGFGTNLLGGAPLWGEPVRSTLCEYVGELARPRETAYGAAAAWVNEHVAEGQSVWVLPEYAISPLMFHAPKAVYAWQLGAAAAERFRGLADIHFKGRVPPDFIIAFGPVVVPLRRTLDAWRGKGWRYEPAAALPVYWRDDTRPELVWHAFRPVTDFDPEREGVHIFRRSPRR